MRGEKRLGAGRGVVVKVFDHRPSDRNAVVGRRAAADFVEQHDAAVRNVIEDAGRFEHLDHEGRLALRNVVRSPDARENLVHIADMGRLRGYVRTHLGHQNDQRGLAQQRRLTRHVGSGDHHNLLLLVVEHHVVGDVLLPHGHQRLDHRMAALTDVDALAVVQHGTHVAAFAGDACEGLEAVDARHRGGVAQHRRQRTADIGHDPGVDALLQDEHLLLGAENLLLVLFQFARNVTLGVGEGLLAYPRLGDLVLVGVADLDIVAENVVVADLERRDAGGLALALLDAREVVLTVERDAAQVVQFGIDAVGDHAALLYLVVLRVGVDFAGDTLADLRQRVDLLCQRMQAVVVGGLQRSLERLDGSERVLELHQFAGRDPLGGDTPRDTLQIAHQRHLLADDIRQIGVFDQPFHHIEALVDLRGVLDRHGDPAFQQAAAHRRQRAVDHVGETALLARAVRRKKLQVADRELVDPHVVVLVDTRNGGDMARFAVLGEFEVVENGPGGRNAAGEVVHAEALEGFGPELLAEFLAVDVLRKDPLVETVSVEFRPERTGKTVLVAALVDDLLGLEVRDQLVYIAVRSLGHIELARGDVQKSHARRLPAEIDRRDEVVLLVGQDVVAQHDARSHQFDHAALDESLHQLGILQLLADGHALARPHQLRQVGVDGMVGKSRQFDVRRRSVGAARERDAQNAAGLDRVVAEGLVEIAHAEQQNGVGMYCLDGVILLHQGRLDIFFVDFLFGSQNRILYNLYDKDRPFLNTVQSRHPIFFVCPAGSFRPSVRESRSRRTLCGKTPPSTPRDAGRPATRRACATASGRAPQRASARTPPRPVRRSP